MIRQSILDIYKQNRKHAHAQCYKSLCRTHHTGKRKASPPLEVVLCCLHCTLLQFCLFFLFFLFFSLFWIFLLFLFFLFPLSCRCCFCFVFAVVGQFGICDLSLISSLLRTTRLSPLPPSSAKPHRGLPAASLLTGKLQNNT